MSEIGLSGFGAQGRELGTVEGHEVLVLGMFVGESLQHVGVIVVTILDVLVSQEGYALQFLFVSHYLKSLMVFPFSVMMI